ncbi:MAG: methyltransferase domain-containing protein [Candidatus Binatia bacterium]
MAKLKHDIGTWLIPKLPINRRTFDILRFEFGCLSQRLSNACDLRYHLQLLRLRKLNGLSVNFGSGGRGINGWINIDARANHADLSFAYDIRRRLPFRDAQVKRILAEHVIEHLDFRDDVPQVFREFWRILEPGGTVRIVVPDAERFMSAYVKQSASEFQELGWDLEHLPSDIYTPAHIVNLVFHQNGEHLFGWDFTTLELALRKAGFPRVVKQSFEISLDPHLAIDQDQHRHYSLYVEAVK